MHFDLNFADDQVVVAEDLYNLEFLSNFLYEVQINTSTAFERAQEGVPRWTCSLTTVWRLKIRKARFIQSLLLKEASDTSTNPY